MMIWRFVHQHLAECRNDVHYRYHIIWKVAYKENSVNHPHVHANLMWISFEKSLSCVFCVEILEVFDICKKKKLSKHGHSKPWCELVCDMWINWERKLQYKYCINISSISFGIYHEVCQTKGIFLVVLIKHVVHK